ncbi:DoxX family protein [Evansella clarkii]|uniref:DoxX family protein n=1 Tax=Evansella clarkii TaxID=79879 RepID=UPI000B436B44|nr:DoxX family protein [Evansella clarkii]
MADKNEMGAVILRVVLGVVFLAHGLDKIQGGVGNTAAWFDSIGLPGFLAYAVVLIETAGGIALILGLATRIVAGLLAVVLAGAIITVQLSAGFLGGYAYDLALLAMAVYLFINGSKLYSADQLLFSGKKESETAVESM